MNENDLILYVTLLSHCKNGESVAIQRGEMAAARRLAKAGRVLMQGQRIALPSDYPSTVTRLVSALEW